MTPTKSIVFKFIEFTRFLDFYNELGFSLIFNG